MTVESRETHTGPPAGEVDAERGGDDDPRLGGRERRRVQDDKDLWVYITMIPPECCALYVRDVRTYRGEGDGLGDETLSPALVMPRGSDQHWDNI